ncbi:orotate phosphoribosyltransferase [Acidiluteibacter ferrifornacis]|uniref:Orotate phosphoribosyltransferase n=1 Tax=Acidiluteibacter ferrifornacis TaxID=2692424 RepID=A0A6N9NJC3_9FLAO|nr:orotate phosphoribosyltransferase [Acidiluteibacter ferrifornacis]NBG66023.1 orotate phosphoribosyltransferase [Acidiluteibacter ferrifornacis]
MNATDDTALKVAEFLLQIKAIKLNNAEPFTWASGWKSPIYCDNRKTLSYPPIRTYIRQIFVEKIREKYGTPDVIAGVATGGIALAALIAQEMELPMIYVRSSSKGHGLQNQIEGVLEKGQKVVVIEDLISTGMSSLKAVEALRTTGADVVGMVAIFTYGFDVAVNNFKDYKCPLITLTDYEALLEVAVETSYIQKHEISSLKEWRENPSTWKQ